MANVVRDPREHLGSIIPDLSGRRTIICATVGQLSSCAPIHRRSVSALVSSKRPVETGQQDESCPTIAQIIVPRPLRWHGSESLTNRDWGSGAEAVTPRDLSEVKRAGLRRPLLRLAIDGHQPKLGAVTVNPLVVVEQRPVDIAAHVDTVGEAILYAD